MAAAGGGGGRGGRWRAVAALTVEDGRAQHEDGERLACHAATLAAPGGSGGNEHGSVRDPRREQRVTCPVAGRAGWTIDRGLFGIGSLVQDRGVTDCLTEGGGPAGEERAAGSRRNARSTAGPRRGVRPTAGLLGPAFVAAVAYVDPGNVASNLAAGARYGYLLLWVVVGASAVAILVQYLSAKLSVATGATLPEVCRDRLPRPVTRGMWLQAELVAAATDLAELVGGAIALRLLFGVPLLTGGLITGAVAFAVLLIQSRYGQRPFESVVMGLLGVVVVGFFAGLFTADPAPAEVVNGLVPRLAGGESLLLAAGIVGATVMPHAIYLHGAAVRDRHGGRLGDLAGRLRLLRVTRMDVIVAMVLASLVNVTLLVTAAAALSPADGATFETAYAGIGRELGTVVAIVFALGLLASGLAGTSVGTYAGSVICDGFLRRRVPLTVRRAVTLIPGLLVLAAGVEPAYALVLSQVVLSLGIPFALWPLIVFTSRRPLMGALVNRRRTVVVAVTAALAITALDLALVAITLA
ncbi:MAG: Mn(2+) uptake NRAMP transporter MntH [Streptosporangiales bacterium]|nr:Mn(2+) uptake NRAMP transporter MntH [Streptosporangiales bacterium]